MPYGRACILECGVFVGGSGGGGGGGGNVEKSCSVYGGGESSGLSPS